MPREHLFIPTSDGTRLAATLYSPDGGGPWPAILEALPYRKDDITASYRPEYVRLAEKGYVVCRLDVRGTGSSEGIAPDEYSAQERQDLLEVIGWLASQSWSSGAVGMYGTSYSGFNSLQIASDRPPELKAIISIFASDDRHGDDVHYFGGALKQLDLLDYPLYMVAMNALPPVPARYGEGWRELWERRVLDTDPWEIAWLEHQRFDDYWKYGSLRMNYGSVEAATMLVTGWADGYKNIGLRAFEGLRCPKRLLAGPWGHAAVDASLPGPNIDLVPEMLKWWDRWLKGIEGEPEPPITVFVRRSTKIDFTTRQISGGWRYEPTWPLDRGTQTRLELEKAAAPGREGDGPDALAIRGDVGWTGWISCAGNLPWGQPGDQRPDEAYSLVYEWEPLEEEVEILGHPILEVTVSSSTPIAYLSAKLCDVFPDGYSSLVTRGMLNLAQRESRDSPSPLEPGRAYRIAFELEVTSWVFEVGHRIRLDLAGADWPNTWAPPHPGTLTIDRTGGTLTLPTVEGPSPVREPPVMTPPAPGRTQEAFESAKGNVTEGVEWRIEHDALGRETRAVAGSSGTTPTDEERPKFREEYGGTVGVSVDDPGSAWVDGRAVFEIAWPEVTVRSEAHHRVESDATTYRLKLELDVSENGEPRWSRRWEREFPRDHQ